MPGLEPGKLVSWPGSGTPGAVGPGRLLHSPTKWLPGGDKGLAHSGRPQRRPLLLNDLDPGSRRGLHRVPRWPSFPGAPARAPRARVQRRAHVGSSAPSPRRLWPAASPVLGLRGARLVLSGTPWSWCAGALAARRDVGFGWRCRGGQVAPRGIPGDAASMASSGGPGQPSPCCHLFVCPWRASHWPLRCGGWAPPPCVGVKILES